MHKVTGRSDDIIIIRGVNVFPTQVESVLLEPKSIPRSKGKAKRVIDKRQI